MTPDPPERPKRDPDDPLTQMNVRVPKSLRDAIDARRSQLGLSRDRWVENAVKFALTNRPASTPLNSTRGRTAPPPHRRPQ